ncbi:MAG: putative pyridoxal phosphate-dependent acyltransferase [Anaerolineales bacterium]|nr:putative pyridoxal phosphate-dependent acyltransferase [Anaerolineales bacterium]
MSKTRDNDRLGFVREQLAELKDEGLYANIRSLGSAQEAWLEIEGRRVLNFCSNNYLGLANHPRLVARAKQAMDDFGVGPAAVRTIAGTMDLHRDLEERLAQFKGVEAAILFQSGFSANLAVIPALVGKQDAIVSDALNHASIIDGIRLTKSDRYIYEHTDMDDLRVKLEEAAGNDYRAILVVTDGVFSMDGDIAPLDEITELAEAFGAITMVDDAHGEGVLGHGGRGIVDHFDLHGRVDIEVGTLSKAFGVVGGYVAGNGAIVEWLRQRGRPFLFSSATTVPDTAACLAAVDLLEESTELVDGLWDNARYFQAGMRDLGFDTGKTQTPITPVMLGEAPLAQKFSQRLFEEGVFGTAIGYPTVPLGLARIRVMISAAHEEDDLDFGLETFEDVGRELGVI